MPPEVRRLRKLILHQLEHCRYLSTRNATQDDDTSPGDNESRVVDGAWWLHSGHCTGGGDGVNERDTLDNETPSMRKVEITCGTLRGHWNCWKLESRVYTDAS